MSATGSTSSSSPTTGGSTFVPPSNASMVSVPNVTNAHDTLSLENRVREVAGCDVNLGKILEPSPFRNEKDPGKLCQILAKEFNKNVPEDARVIVNAGARAGVRVDPGYYYVGHRNQRPELRVGNGDRLCLSIQVGFTDAATLGQTTGHEEGVVRQTDPLIGGFSTWMVNVPQGKYAKVYLGQNPKLLDEGSFVFHSALFRPFPDRNNFLVDQSATHIQVGTIHVIRVKAAHYGKVVLNSVPLLLPYRGNKPYVFDSALFSYEGEVPESSTYISHQSIHVIRVPAAQVAKVWNGSKPMMLEYRENPYHFEDPAFRAEERTMFANANQKMVQHGTILRLRPGVTGELEKAVVQSDGEIRFIDKFTVLDSSHDALLGFLPTGIITAIYPSEKVRASRRRENPQAAGDAINFEVMTTRDGCRIGMKLLVAYQIEDPALCLSRLSMSNISEHVESVSVSDMVRAVSHASSTNFMTALAQKSTSDSQSSSADSLSGSVGIAEEIREKLSSDLLECGIQLRRCSIEESRILDEHIAKEMAKQSLVAAEAGSLTQRAAIARSKAEVDNMASRLQQEQANEILVSKAKAELDAAKMRGEAMLVEARAKAEASKLEGELLEKYPSLLQLKVAQLQANALNNAKLSIVAPSIAQSPYSLNALGMWNNNNQTDAKK